VSESFNVRTNHSKPISKQTLVHVTVPKPGLGAYTYSQDPSNDYVLLTAGRLVPSGEWWNGSTDKNNFHAKNISELN